MFQFHKVQLKGKALRRTTLLKMFQFHKVQLKANELMFGFRPRYLFQFHKVQLKVVDSLVSQELRNNVSIP